MKKLLFIASTAILLLPGCCCFRDTCDSCPGRGRKAAPTAAEEGPVVITEDEIVKVSENLDMPAPKLKPVQKGKKSEIIEEEFDEILVK